MRVTLVCTTTPARPVSKAFAPLCWNPHTMHASLVTTIFPAKILCRRPTAGDIFPRALLALWQVLCCPWRRLAGMCSTNASLLCGAAPIRRNRALCVPLLGLVTLLRPVWVEMYVVPCTLVSVVRNVRPVCCASTNTASHAMLPIMVCCCWPCLLLCMGCTYYGIE